MSAENNGLSIPVNQSAPVQPVPANESLAPERVLFTPPIDIYETGDGLVLVAELPGVSVHSLDLQVQNNKLTLLGRESNSISSAANVLNKVYVAVVLLL